jgi:hypothetical protein
MKRGESIQINRTIFLKNYEEYLHMIDLKEMPGFQTFSRISRIIDLHEPYMQVFNNSKKKNAGKIQRS